MSDSVTLWTVALQAPLSMGMGILQARILEWVATPFSRRSSWPRDWTRVSCIAGRLFTVWAAREALPSSEYLRLLIFLLAVLIPACDSSSPAFCVMYSAYKLNRQGDNIQPWQTPFPIWNQSVVPCPVLTVACWPASDFSGSRSGDLVFASLSEFSTVCCDPHSQRLWHSQ